MKKLGVFDLPTVQRLHLEKLITFENTSPPTMLDENAIQIAKIASATGADLALVQLPAFIISSVERELLKRNIRPLHAWGSVQRYSVESEFGDHEIIKLGFKLFGFIEVHKDGIRRFPS